MSTPAQTPPPQQQSQQPQPPQLQRSAAPQMAPPPPPKPYQPTPEEMAYLQACGEAITAGCSDAVEAASAGDGGKYLEFANGVKALTAAYVEIKTGGKAATGHQGA